MKLMNRLEYTVDAVGGAYGIAFIKDILGLIVLILTICSILFRAGIIIHNKIKNGKIEEIPDVLDDTKDQIEKVKDGK